MGWTRSRQDEWIDASAQGRTNVRGLFWMTDGRTTLAQVSGSIGLLIDMLSGCPCSGLMAVRKVSMVSSFSNPYFCTETKIHNFR